MPLPIDIEDLLNKNRVESNRIEFKAGWNPDKIYHTICAFANDIDNIGGGYILVGVEEENGIAKRPVKGLPPESVDRIMKDMVGFDAKIEPYYMCKVYHRDYQEREPVEITIQKHLRDNGSDAAVDDIKDLKRKILIPLISMDYVTMSNPDKPTSPNQKYKLTEKGRKLFE
jgi:predicted HTH transcriptional regulator